VLSHHILLSCLSSCFTCSVPPRHLHSFPTRRSSDLPYLQDRLTNWQQVAKRLTAHLLGVTLPDLALVKTPVIVVTHDLIASEARSEEHTSELQSRFDLVCRLLLEKKKNIEYTRGDDN